MTTPSENSCQLTPVERAIALRKIEAFRRVPMEQLAHLAAATVEHTYPEGYTLFREGEPPGSLYVILEGRITLVRQQKVFGVAEAGEALGTWSLFDEHPRKAEARVECETRVLVLDRDDFYTVLSEHVEITRSLVQDLVRRLLELTGLDREEDR